MTVERFLAEARSIVAEVTDCWAATPSGNGGVSVRVVVPIAGVPGEEDWTVWFAAGATSRKVAEIRRTGHLTLGYQDMPRRSYVALIGRAAVVADRAVIRARWKEEWRSVFPDGDAVFVRLETDRIELYALSPPPAPPPRRHSTLERDAERRWRLVG